jgi:hypothetical protein
MSLMKPVKKTPEARMWTSLEGNVSRGFDLGWWCAWFFLPLPEL